MDSPKTWQKLKKNPELFQRYFVKEYIIKAIRIFFENRKYHELESPILAPALPQEHYLNPLTVEIGIKDKKDQKAYLIPSTERYNKIMLAAGLGEHFVITKVFRGLEENSPNHSIEFTMCEWYHLDANYFDLMDDCEELFICIQKYLCKNLFKKDFSYKILFGENSIDLTPKWQRLSIVDCLMDYCSIDIKNIQDLGDFQKIAIKKGYNISENDDWEVIFELIFANEIEPQLDQTKPVFLYDYPKQLCPLTRLNPNNPLVAQKVELYIAGKEIANGYTELTDGDEQEARFKKEVLDREKIGKEPITFDYELIEALKSGLPEVAGIGMGIDRIAMIFANAKCLDDINYFPASNDFN
jgi:elongation factor P--beta-lysine ligase